jgi:hypothetical protein
VVLLVYIVAGIVDVMIVILAIIIFRP